MARETKAARRLAKKEAQQQEIARQEQIKVTHLGLVAQIQEVENWVASKLISIFDGMSPERKNELLDNEYRWFAAKTGSIPKITDLFMIEFRWLSGIKITPVLLNPDDPRNIIYTELNYSIDDQPILLEELERYIREFEYTIPKEFPVILGGK